MIYFYNYEKITFTIVLSYHQQSESPVPKPLVEIYVSSVDAVSVESLLQKSFMISAICSRAANCDRAFMVSLAQQQQGKNCLHMPMSYCELMENAMMFLVTLDY